MCDSLHPQRFSCKHGSQKFRFLYNGTAYKNKHNLEDKFVSCLPLSAGSTLGLLDPACIDLAFVWQNHEVVNPLTPNDL
jgi:hypothetical protein